MSLFVREGKIKSTLLMTAFCLSLLYVVVFLLAFLMTADLVAAYVPAMTGKFLQVWLPPILVCIAPSLLCSAPLLFFKDKRLVPAALSFLALYSVLLLILTARQAPESREVLRQLILLYAALPAGMGNLAGWGGYLLISRRKTAK